MADALQEHWTMGVTQATLGVMKALGTSTRQMEQPRSKTAEKSQAQTDIDRRGPTQASTGQRASEKYNGGHRQESWQGRKTQV